MAAHDPSPTETLDSKPAPTGGVGVAAAEPAGPAERKPTHESVGSVIAAIVANILVGIVKFIAAAISGSVAMVSEGIHSIVDSGNGFLVLLGIHQAKKPPTIEHPFGFGKELYFWTLVVAVSIFALGGGVSIMQGITAIQHALAGTAEHGNPLMSYIVLFAAMVIEGFSLRVAVKSFNKARGSKRPLEYIKDCKDPSLYTVVLEDSAAELGLVFAFLRVAVKSFNKARGSKRPLEYIKDCKDPSLYTVVLEDSAAELGLVFAFFGLLLTHLTGNAVFDGAASVIIGLLLMCVSVVLLRESKGLLVGEGMEREELAEARAMVEADPAVEKAGRVLTMYFGPDSMLMTVDATFKASCTAGDVLAAVDRIEKNLATRFPQTTRIFIEAENIASVETVDATFKASCTAGDVLAAVDRIEKNLATRFPQTTRIFIEAENIASVERQRVIQSQMPEE